MDKIRPSELDDRLPDDAFVLDLRPLGDYERDHIDGSHNAPVYDDLRDGDAEALDPFLDHVPDDVEVVTVCKAGVVAEEATSHLHERGYEATTLACGYRGWRHYEQNTKLHRLSSFLRGLVA
ncbi:rhodanese-like domain-containing protein [Halorussus sp. MSC15.2]|uniref:rhodanese-like domain-containing protein n=1 Tax=Halorussus sp. MSC15.2 TaxID=2283638 RepID=UPI0013D040EC|nr:rhodanese-like domain-containing protein [Halorussus sp. MSC15.2]NEU56037.1 rhodanese-like domain-containing protein [Halorussus sp. MSC15.2]